MFFVGVSFDDPQVDRLFDLARIILDPEYARKAHITLRGPYKRKANVNEKWLETQIENLTLTRPGSFFNENQSTVYLRADIPGIGDFWHKPDYPEGVPHLSVYDGKDRSFAWQILMTLRKFNWQLRLRPTKMKVIDTKVRLETKFILDQAHIDKAMSAVWGKYYSMEDIKRMYPGQRIAILNSICDALHLTHPSSTH